MNAVAPDAPLPTYAAQGQVPTVVLSAAMRDADDPTVVADVIVKAATDKRPGLRYAVGPIASRVTVLRRSVPPSLFDRRIRKLNRLQAVIG